MKKNDGRYHEMKIEGREVPWQGGRYHGAMGGTMSGDSNKPSTSPIAHRMPAPELIYRLPKCSDRPDIVPSDSPRARLSNKPSTSPIAHQMPTPAPIYGLPGRKPWVKALQQAFRQPKRGVAGVAVGGTTGQIFSPPAAGPWEVPWPALLPWAVGSLKCKGRAASVESITSSAPAKQTRSKGKAVASGSRSTRGTAVQPETDETPTRVTGTPHMALLL
ncbi:hypothetical protein C8F04DRAFT_1191133 [Mycena alexandri]|uniref:Uncharacterized protein n=1 Tax=Mycena alexandri TaxID=1745969 RepID=A0AAD6SGV4_9AGAR|nr:hypothetical protein C8F04DRAFT_1191133 [Mycena alexandri]